jgi:Family of unknown function (DUF5703)
MAGGLPASGNIPGTREHPASAGIPGGVAPVALVQQRTPMLEYSYRVVYLPRSTSRDAARRILTDHAEHGDWELTRLRLFADGSRKATLRRQIIRAVRTPRGARAPKWGNVP